MITKGHSDAYDNDIKYMFVQENLGILIEAIGDAFVEELFLLTYKPRHFSQPTKEEEDRLEWLLGSTTSKRILQAAEIGRFGDKRLEEQPRMYQNIITILRRKRTFDN